MEAARLIRGAEMAVLAGISTLVLSSCDTIAGDYEYNPDGTASLTYYERIDNGDLPPSRGAVDSIFTYGCIEDVPGVRLVEVAKTDPEGNLLETTSRDSAACNDDFKITDPEIP